MAADVSWGMATREPHLIFLSHSGQQKPFVQKLDEALRWAGHDPFFDVLSLPPGEEYPPLIFHNVRGCKVGVAVLSLGFLTSKWPMIELHAMHTSPSRPIILPLFYEVQPNDLKPSSSIFHTWKSAWLKMAEEDPRINVIEWEDAIKRLPPINGIVYQKDMIEEQFVEKVLQSISSIVRPLPRYELSHLTGNERITKVVADLFEDVPRAAHLKARVLGFYGIGGQGKTTVCKFMIHHYARTYAGRCALIQFPSEKCTEKDVAAECKAALQQLVKINQSTNAHASYDFDECLQHLKRGVSGRHVFITIDNIWEDSLQFAQRILNVGFGEHSKVLVTSRSKQVLLNLLQDKSCVKQLPGLNVYEASQLFARAFKRNQGLHDIKLKDEDMEKVTRSLLYHDQYHPLSINAAGVTLGKMERQDWLTVWEAFRHKSNKDTEETIRRNFTTISRSMQIMFLDIALIYIPEVQDCKERYEWDFPFLTRHSSTRQAVFSVLLGIWLTAVESEEIFVHNVSTALAYTGLLDFEGLEVRVHDLYKELASQEAAVCHRFALSSCDNLSNGGMNHMEVERIVCSSFPPKCFEGVFMFPKLQVLLIKGSSKWKVFHMPELRVLRAHTESLTFQMLGQGKSGWEEYMPKLVWFDVRIKGDFQSFRMMNGGISSLRNLRVLQLEGYSDYDFAMDVYDYDFERPPRRRHRRAAIDYHPDTILCLEGLVNLQILSIIRVPNLYEVSGLGSLTNLQHVRVLELESLRRAGTFHGSSTKLQSVRFLACPKLMEVLEVSNLESLQQLCLCNLRELPDLSALAALEDLAVEMDAEAGRVDVFLDYGLPKLKSLRIRGGTVEEIGSSDVDNGLPRLERLVILQCQNEVLDFSALQNLSNLRDLHIIRCEQLREIEWSCLNDLINLEEVDIRDCSKLECLRGEPAGMNRTLRFLNIEGCGSLNGIEGRDLLSEECVVSCSSPTGKQQPDTCPPAAEPCPPAEINSTLSFAFEGRDLLSDCLVSSSSPTGNRQPDTCPPAAQPYPLAAEPCPPAEMNRTLSFAVEGRDLPSADCPDPCPQADRDLGCIVFYLNFMRSFFSFLRRKLCDCI